MIKNIHPTKHFIKRYYERNIFKITHMSIKQLLRYIVRIENLIFSGRTLDNDNIINIYKLGKIIIITDVNNTCCITIFTIGINNTKYDTIIF